MSQPQYLDYEAGYRQEKILGQGGYATVVLAVPIDEPARKVAVKLLSLQLVARHKDYVKREITNHKLLTHPYVISLEKVFATSHHLAMVMEYASGGDLNSYLNNSYPPLPEKESRQLFQQLIFGLDYCHRKGVANRDLKLENLLLGHDSKGNRCLKICDFGLSKHEVTSAARTRVGTPNYMAPEIIFASSGNAYDAKKADIWSCGVILYTLVFARYPFDVNNGDSFGLEQDSSGAIPESGFTGRVRRAEFTLPSDIQASNEVIDLIGRLLVADPDHRLDVQGIMSHPWFQKDLPPEAMALNDQCARITAKYTSEWKKAIDKFLDQICREW